MRNNSTKTNECVIHFLYGYDITGALIDPSDLKFTMKLLLVSKTRVQAARQLATEIVEKIELIDKDIENISTDYELERVSKIDLAILRWAFFLHDSKKIERTTDLINEAIRLSKKFSTKEASKFIHAILDGKTREEKSGDEESKLQESKVEEIECEKTEDEKAKNEEPEESEAATV